MCPGVDFGHPNHYALLLRRRDSRGNESLPMAFLPVAECYKLMTDIDCRVAGAAMRILAQRDLVPEAAMFLISLSGASLTDEAFLDDLGQAISASPFPAQCICFESAEASAISNIHATGSSMGCLRKLGCRFALDDFGRGPSSFGYLKNLDIDYIKVNAGFV
jgi:EAL domain-containing protein (putative c-di-GMP-specific phosphodiesterase class I)